MENLQSYTDRLTEEQLSFYLSTVNNTEELVTLSDEEKIALVKSILDSPFLDLLCDWAFKHVFGQNLDLLELLLRDILQMDLTIEASLPNEIDRFSERDKGAIMDVICKLNDGRRIIVEMQRRDKDSFKDRIAYYGAAQFVKQLQRSKSYSTVHAVYVVCFTNFRLPHQTDVPGKIIYSYDLRERETGELYGEYISLNFCELPRLAKKTMKGMTLQEGWCYILKNMRTFVSNPRGIPEHFMPVLEASRTNSLTDKNLQQYFRAMVSDYERKDIAAAYYRRGVEEGVEKGKAEGRAEGRAEGLEETARRMLADKVSPETIVKYTGLTEEQVKAL